MLMIESQKRGSRVLEKYNRSQEPTSAPCVVANKYPTNIPTSKKKDKRGGKVPLRSSRWQVLMQSERTPEISRGRRRATQDIWTNWIQKELTGYTGSPMSRNSCANFSNSEVAPRGAGIIYLVFECIWSSRVCIWTD